ncbi:MAG: extracellular solute-binding protein [Clostridia bacterium]|nr:extracellular solute-binding protein [Clostridia bacterium]
MAKLKKLACAALAVMIVLPYSGCGKTDTTEEDKSSSTEMPKEVSVFGWRSSSLGEEMIDYNDVNSFKLMEEKTGTRINWILPPSSGYDEKFNLMIASEELPDVVIAGWKSLGVNKYAEDNVIIPLDDMKDCMPNFISYLEKHPEFKKDIVAGDGKIYYLPYIREDKELNVYYGPQIRQDWLDKLNLEMPATADELYEVLKAFKTKDPNGNGKADEIPFTCLGAANACHLLAMFDTMNDFYVKDGRIKYGFMEPEFEEGMSYISKLFAEGLIDVDYVFQDRAKMDGKMTNNLAGMMYSYQPTNISNTMAEKDPGFKLVGMPHMMNKSGQKVTDLKDYIQSIIATSAAITSKCKNPKGVLKWLDSFYSDEGIEIMNFGKENETFTMADGVHKFTDEILNNPEYSVGRAAGRNIGAFNSYFPTVQKWESYSQTLSPYGIEAINTWSDVDTSMLLPEMNFTDEEKEELTNLLSPITTYVSERIDKIIMGQESLDTFESARKTVTDMGIGRAMEIYQNAYDRYLKADSSF